MHLPGWDSLRVDKSQACSVHLYEPRDLLFPSTTWTAAESMADSHQQHTGCCLTCQLTSGAAWIVTEDLKGTSATDVPASSSLQGNSGLKASHCTTTVCARVVSKGLSKGLAECQ